MPNQITKFLSKLEAKDPNVVDRVIVSIIVGEFKGLEVKKLSGTDTFYRVRKGPFRIIFKKNEDKNIICLVDRRSENTYKK